jgi:hypothetical protein
MDTFNVTVQEFTFLNLTDATEDFKVVSKHEMGRVTNRITNNVDENTQ